MRKSFTTQRVIFQPHSYVSLREGGISTPLAAFVLPASSDSVRWGIRAVAGAMYSACVSSVGAA